MGWERDYYLNGRPYITGFNLLKNAYEYGELDEKDGISFAVALKGLIARIDDKHEIPGTQISNDQLLLNGHLMHGPMLSETVEFFSPEDNTPTT